MASSHDGRALSVKALRLYDELGVLVPARVDEASGYRYYDVAQLEAARLVAMLRQLDVPLAAIRELLACDPVDAAERIAAHWREVESAHDARRELADYLVNRLSGKRSVMYEVATREMPERSVLCLKRNVDEQGAWALGKEFIAILRERPLPKMEGREGAMFTIYWGEVSADSDGPVEMCKPVPEEKAQALASHYPELSLRTEPAHREAYVALPNDALPGGPVGTQARNGSSRRRLCRPGRSSMGSTLNVSPSSPRISACELPTSRAGRSLRRAPPTATSPCRSPERGGSRECAVHTAPLVDVGAVPLLRMQSNGAPGGADSRVVRLSC